MYPNCASRACVGVGGLGGNYFARVAPIKGNLVALLFWGLIEGLAFLPCASSLVLIFN
jgi:hypothetical protein